MDKKIEEGSITFYFKNLPAVKLADEVKLWIYTRGIGGGFQLLQSIYALTTYNSSTFVFSAHSSRPLIGGIISNS